MTISEKSSDVWPQIHLMKTVALGRTEKPGGACQRFYGPDFDVAQLLPMERLF